MEKNNFVVAKLPNNKQFNLLVDSGSSRTLISKNFVENNKIFESCKKTDIKPIVFKVGNGGTLISTQKCYFDIYVQHVKISLYAFIVDALIGVELVLGDDVLTELGGTLDFEAKIVKFRDKRIVLTPVRDYVIRPGRESHIVLRGRFPKIVKNSEFVVKTQGKLRSLTASELLVRAKNGSIVIPVANKTNRVIKLEKSKLLAIASTSSMVAIALPIPARTTECAMHISSAKLSSKQTEVEKNNLRAYPHLKKGDPLASLDEKQAMREQKKS